MTQCARDTRCVKEKGHKGWCKVTGEKEWEEPPKRSSRGGAAASKVAKMQALGAKRERQATRQGDNSDSGDGDEGEEEGEGTTLRARTRLDHPPKPVMRWEYRSRYSE